MSALAEDLAAAPGEIGSTPAGAGPPPPAGGGPLSWEYDGRKRAFLRPPGGGNVVFRRGDETPEEALDRASRPDSDKKPPKPRAKKLPKQQTNEQDLKTLEVAIAQVLMAPGQVAGALLQDEWLLLHFQARSPELARALINAAEQNPWLRKKLLELASGGAAAMQLQAIVILALATGAYAVPPLAYLLGWEIHPVIQVSVLGGPIPRRNRPAPVAQPVQHVPPANVTPPANEYGEPYGEGSAEAA